MPPSPTTVVQPLIWVVFRLAAKEEPTGRAGAAAKLVGLSQCIHSDSRARAAAAAGHHLLHENPFSLAASQPASLHVGMHG